jgi:hypothetical protein
MHNIKRRIYMKKTSIAILFTVLITATCMFASCNGYGADGQDQQESDSYESTIRELEDRILQLQRDQFISNSERDKQISKLETEIAQLKKQSESSTVPDESESESDSTEQDSDSETETETEALQKSEFLYTVTDGTATITGYQGSDLDLILPSQIDGYDVVAISDDAFSGCELNTVVISGTVKKIGWFAFKDCESLRSVTVPDSVVSIGYDAFPDDSRMSIICTRGSFAAQYAASYGISVTVICALIPLRKNNA